ncbi:hypothetical protein ABK040_004454 [Willaertia magna]
METTDSVQVEIQPQTNYAGMNNPRTETNNKDDKSTNISKALFISGFFIPICWIVSIFLYWKSNNKQTYRWRRYSIRALVIELSLLFLIGWIVIIVFALIPYPDPEKFNSTMVNAMNMYPGEFMAIFWGLAIVAVVGYEFIVDIFLMCKNTVAKRRRFY